MTALAPGKRVGPAPPKRENAARRETVERR